MSSERRKASSRANGAKSHGPKTAEGKARASMNATKHGVCAETNVLAGESAEAFEQYRDSYAATMQPTSEVEFDLVEQMVFAQWRIRRAWAAETAALNRYIAAKIAGDGLEKITAAYRDGLHYDLLKMQRYEVHLDLMYRRALDNFLKLRTKLSSQEETVEAPAEESAPAAKPNNTNKQTGPKPAPAAAAPPSPECPDMGLGSFGKDAKSEVPSPPDRMPPGRENGADSARKERA